MIFRSRHLEDSRLFDCYLAERHGEPICVHDPLRSADIEAVVCSPVFFDPDGGRMRG